MTNLDNSMQVNATVAIQAVEMIGLPAGTGYGRGIGTNLDGVPMALTAFLKVIPSIFKGTTNPAEADNWFKAVECALQTQHNIDIPWELFRTAFYKKYFPESIREARELELMQLKQGSMSVVEYTSKFEKLCRFSRVCQGVPESYVGWKCIRYQGVLRGNIMSVVTLLEIRRFYELVNKARIVEDYAKETTLVRDDHGGTSSRSHGKYVPSRG
ncbi:uncharacterized protein LOC130966638 [Arachis stenosperma]|uniref:uncharacterized protein LOC130966638 n=1 Tax=Arachis stenosperma TaxID=217475 RepID=UPI0025ACCF8B|nr:uncharacterized protein LOC130966638 [Arachis stenosperma]